MSYTYQATEIINDFEQNLYKMIEIRVLSSNDKFQHRAIPIWLSVEDNNNVANGFSFALSGNQKELIAYFTVDAFTGFSHNSSILFGYGTEVISGFGNFSPQNIPPLPDFLASIPHSIADNAWLQTL